MPRVAAAFFVTGALFVLVGMVLGGYMGAHEDFRLTPVHAHINLVGWVTMALYGTFYALTAKTMSKRLAWTNYVLATVAVLVMTPSLAAYLLTQNKAYLGSVIGGEALAMLGMLIFLVSAVRELLRKRDTDASQGIIASPVGIATE